MLKKPGKITLGDAITMARHLVTAWEAIDGLALKRQAEFGWSDEMRDEFASDMREMAGSETMYLACKAFLETIPLV